MINFNKNYKKKLFFILLLVFSFLKEAESSISLFQFKDAIGLTNGKILLWDSIENEVPKILTGHKFGVNVLRMQKSFQLISGSNDNTIRVWNRTDHVCTINKHKDWIRDIKVLPEKDILVSASDDQTIQFTRLSTCKSLFEKIVVNQNVLSMKLINNNTHLACGCSDSIIRVYKLKENESDENELVQSLKVNDSTAQISSLAYLSESFLISGDSDGRVRLWNTSSWELAKTIEDFFIASVIRLKVFTWNKTDHLMCTDSRGIIRVWELKDLSLKFKLKSSVNTIFADVLSESSQIVSLSFDGTMNTWNLNSTELVQTLKVNSNESAKFYSFLELDHEFENDFWKSNNRIRKSQLKLTDAESVSSSNSLEDQTSKNLSLDLEVIFGANNNSIITLELFKNKSTSVLNGHMSPVSALKLHRNGFTLISGAYDNTIKVWDLKYNTLLCDIYAHTNVIAYVGEFSESILITASYDGLVKFWLQNTCELEDLFYTGEHILNIFRMDADHLAISYTDLSFKIWSLKRKKCIVNLNSPNLIENRVYSFESTKDFLITGHINGRIRMWNKTSWVVVKAIEEFVPKTIMNLKMININQLDYLVSIDNVGVMKIWNMTCLKLVNTLFGFPNGMDTQIFYLELIDKDRFLSRSTTGLLNLWTINGDARNVTLQSFNLTESIFNEGISTLVYFNRSKFELNENENKISSDSNFSLEDVGKLSNLNIFLSLNTNENAKVSAYNKAANFYHLVVPFNSGNYLNLNQKIKKET